ncbi:hypothetical protein F5B21DRAFT_245262 [Xylaria acuta]|nr:hypothetical protein F5B21DRAFT_245262 [Xylaria acuta]
MRGFAAVPQICSHQSCYALDTPKSCRYAVGSPKGSWSTPSQTSTATQRRLAGTASLWGIGRLEMGTTHRTLPLALASLGHRGTVPGFAGPRPTGTRPRNPRLWPCHAASVEERRWPRGFSLQALPPSLDECYSSLCCRASWNIARPRPGEFR